MYTHMTFQDAHNTALYICEWTVVNYICLGAWVNGGGGHCWNQPWFLRIYQNFLLKVNLFDYKQVFGIMQDSANGKIPA